MRLNVDQHLVKIESTAKEALPVLENLSSDAIIFIVDADQLLKGSMTDGDVRRGLMAGKSIDESVEVFMQSHPKFLKKGEFDLEKLQHLREKNFKIIPIIDESGRIVDIINFRLLRSYLPLDAVIMAGGKGKRLYPLTENKPKPLLKVGERPILQINIDRLSQYGLDNITITLNYLGEQIKEFFGDGKESGLDIKYTVEESELGTAGALSLIDNFDHQVILVMNSDLLTNIDFEDFYQDFINEDADMAVATIPYEVKVPYAVLETENGQIHSFKEKPTFTYYSNAGIYLIKKEVLGKLEKGVYCDATDLMERLIKDGKKLISYPIRGYWLDIGRMEDYEKAQEDIRHISL